MITLSTNRIKYWQNFDVKSTSRVIKALTITNCWFMLNHCLIIRFCLRQQQKLHLLCCFLVEYPYGWSQSKHAELRVPLQAPFHFHSFCTVILCDTVCNIHNFYCEISIENLFFLRKCLHLIESSLSIVRKPERITLFDIIHLYLVSCCGKHFTTLTYQHEKC